MTEPIKVETKIETRITRFVIVGGKWIFRTETESTIATCGESDRMKSDPHTTT